MATGGSQNWYAANAGRRYPLDEGASGAADDGGRLPPGLLVDASVRFPASLGRAAAVSAAGVGPALVSVVLVGIPAPPRPGGGADGFAPLGVVTVRRPVVPGIPYPVRPLAPGVGGWVVFGSRANGPPLSLRFEGSAGALAQRAARAYPDPPVLAAGKDGVATALAGDVRLTAGPDLEVLAADRVIDGVTRRAVVVRLRQDGTSDRLAAYKGPCGGRPESATCDRPGVEFLNEVGPDCAGNVEIEFADPLVASPLAGGGGLAIDYPYGLALVCGDPGLPGDDGTLPNEYPNPCGSAAPGDPDANAAPPDPIHQSAVSMTSLVADPTPLPVCTDFADDVRWVTVIGEFRPVLVDPGVFSGCGGTYPDGYIGAELADPSVMTAAVWYDGGYDETTGLVTRADVYLPAGEPRYGGGVVLNYRRHPTADLDEFVFVDLDPVGAALRVRRWTGVQFVPLGAVAGVALPTAAWYEVRATTTDVGGGLVQIAAEVYASGGVTPLGAVTVQTRHYLPGTGKNGVGADGGAATFARFRLEDA